MNGTITHSGQQYQWWAGSADPALDLGYCVHCCRGEYGVTRYLSEDPDQSKAEEVANTLAPYVDRMG